MNNNEPDYNRTKAELTISNIPYFSIIKDSLFFFFFFFSYLFHNALGFQQDALLYLVSGSEPIPEWY
ncbi:hypothetical protein BDV27DRAFT_137245 [Aspergillus caelatus]|uniref:Uncharacterized protein n=1 Tax=Aspergillus caelatus TaxID=61420 RepID=A0A5N6ZMB8_9EURO|nr:uncharacterized protein BDV27DRAFT_137245 [Aspergillus caelatus]KAE8358751.1 hypothetical protein BDV27DRAFT_137245 [Aspergillus caelatus]